MWEVLRAPGGAVPITTALSLLAKNFSNSQASSGTLETRAIPVGELKKAPPRRPPGPLGWSTSPQRAPAGFIALATAETVAGVVAHGEGRLALLHHGPRVQRLIVNQVYCQDLILQAAVRTTR